MMHGIDATAGLTSSSNLLEDMDRFDSLDENMESLLSHEIDGRDIYGTIKQCPTEHQKESSIGFTFAEVGCIHTRNSEVTCCHFSSDGKVLATAGHDKKVVFWNMDNLQTEITSEEHKSVITDVRFRPNSTQLATASFDKTVRLWDAANGHSEIINYICWDANGDCLASVSHNLVKIWSVVTGECIQELGAGGNRFHSCVFHPNYSTLLVIGGISSLELWNLAENRSMTISAHENIISALAQSPVIGMVASASHDSSVKQWK